MLNLKDPELRNPEAAVPPQHRSDVESRGIVAKLSSTVDAVRLKKKDASEDTFEMHPTPPLSQDDKKYSTPQQSLSPRQNNPLPPLPNSFMPDLREGRGNRANRPSWDYRSEW